MLEAPDPQCDPRIGAASVGERSTDDAAPHGRQLAPVARRLVGRQPSSRWRFCKIRDSTAKKSWRRNVVSAHKACLRRCSAGFTLRVEEGAAESFKTVRKTSRRICEPLATEDYVIQTMDDVSPPKWHLAHTTWFFESFLLIPSHTGYREFHPRYNYLFNSYYEAVGERHPRPERGLLSRPTVQEVYDYRRHVDQFMLDLIDRADEQRWLRIEPLLTLGFASRTATSRTAFDRHQAHLGNQSTAAGLSAAPRAYALRKRPAAWVAYPSGIAEIGSREAGSATTMKNPVIKCTSRNTSWRTPWSPTGSPGVHRSGRLPAAAVLAF